MSFLIPKHLLTNKRSSLELERRQREALKLQPAKRAEPVHQPLLSFKAARQQDQALIEEVEKNQAKPTVAA